MLHGKILQKALPDAKPSVLRACMSRGGSERLGAIVLHRHSSSGGTANTLPALSPLLHDQQLIACFAVSSMNR